MVNHRSQLEDIMAAEELRFHATPAFGKYRRFLNQAVAHPAKFNTKLVEFLIRKWTREGETVLDCMAGSGSTGVIAALNGRNAILVELEDKFNQWIDVAKAKVGLHFSLSPKGSIVNIKGDARELSKLLRASPDAVLVSPPFSETNRDGSLHGLIIPKALYHEKHLETSWKIIGEKGDAYICDRLQEMGYSDDKKNIGNLSHGSVDAIMTSPPYSEQNQERRPFGGLKEPNIHVKAGRDTMPVGASYGVDPSNVGNLRHGDVDAIITSPPFLKSAVSGSGVNKQRDGDVKIGCSTDGRAVTDGRAIDNCKELGNIDAVITSPPFADTNDRKERKDDATRSIKGRASDLPSNPENIGNLPIDVVIILPPFSEESKGHSGGILAHKGDCQCRFCDRTRGNAGMVRGHATSYSDDKQNIGNLRHGSIETNPESIASLDKESYLSAMLRVYREMFSVLKSRGVAIIAIRAFIRNKRVVDLPFQTWQLLEKVGFQLVKLYKLRLETQSFWRVLYSRKNPEVPQIAHEYVLVCRKPAA